jgi:hypothetical protein
LSLGRALVIFIGTGTPLLGVNSLGGINSSEELRRTKWKISRSKAEVVFDILFAAVVTVYCECEEWPFPHLLMVLFQTLGSYILHTI